MLIVQEYAIPWSRMILQIVPYYFEKNIYLGTIK